MIRLGVKLRRVPAMRSNVSSSALTPDIQGGIIILEHPSGGHPTTKLMPWAADRKAKQLCIRRLWSRVLYFSLPYHNITIYKYSLEMRTYCMSPSQCASRILLNQQELLHRRIAASPYPIEVYTARQLGSIKCDLVLAG